MDCRAGKAPAPARDPAVYYLHPFMERVAAKHEQAMAAIPAYEAGGGDLMRLQELLMSFYRSMQRWQWGWEIYHARSEDRGARFGPPVRLTETTERSMRPSVAVLGEELHLAWFDGRHASEGDENVEIYYRRSLDHGQSWGEEQRITDAPGISPHVSLAVAPSGVHLIWHDQRHGSPEIYYRGARFE